MDRNTLLAFVLIGLVLILMPYYQSAYLPPDEEFPMPIEDTGGRSQPAASSGERRSTPMPVPLMESAPATNVQTSSVTETAIMDSRADERRIHVRTDLYEGQLTTWGGVLTKWTLLTYERRDGEAVSLIRDGRRENLGVSFRTMQGDTVRSITQNYQIVGNTREGDYTVPFGPDGSGSLTLRHDLGDGRSIEKRFTFYRDRYDFDLDLTLNGIAPDVVDGKYFLQWDSGIPMTERDLLDEQKYLKAYTLLGDDTEELEAADPGWTDVSFNGDTRWIATRTKYFGAAVIPRSNHGVGAGLRGFQQPYGNDDLQERDYSLTLAMSLSNQSVHADQFTIFLGPLEYPVISGFGVELEQMMDFGWGFIRPISKLIYRIFTYLYTFIGNYGVVIILFSVLLKIMFHPLTKKSYMSMQAMKDMQPKMTALKEKYAKDPKQLNKAMMRMYKEEGVNPLGGCLPMLLQMPVFFAIYPVFYSTIEFRGAPFFGWISDLSRPDYVLSLPFSLPLYGSHVAILPIIMGISMYFQSSMTMSDPKQKMMVYMMPVMMLLFFNNISSGLVLYWSVFNILSMTEQYLIRYFKNKSASLKTA